MTLSTSPYPIFPVFTMVGFVIVIIPLPWHLEAWNSGTCLYMIWTAISCLNQFVNSVVWYNNALNTAPVWCDISSRIIIGSAVGIPASALCISRRLYHIASVNYVRISKAEKRRAVLIDIGIAVLFPLICIALEYIVQGHRFNIIAEIGCFPATYNTLPAYFLVSMWPILIGLTSATYCVLAIRAFMRRRKQFNELLTNSNNLTTGRYLRLMALAAVEASLTTPLASFSVYLNATGSTVEPWVSWSDTHFNFSRVEQIPSLIWRSSPMTVLSLELTRWLVVVCAFIFFGFFGFAEEARKRYRLAFWFVVKPFGFSPKQTQYEPETFVLSARRRTAVSTIGPLPPAFTRPPRARLDSSTTIDADGVMKPSPSFVDDAEASTSAIYDAFPNFHIDETPESATQLSPEDVYPHLAAAYASEVTLNYTGANAC